MAPDLDRERADLLALHARERRAHFETDADLLVSDFAPEWTYVRDGRVERLTREEARERFAAAFAGATYERWDDVEAPMVTISADARVAWMLTRVHVRCTTPGSEALEFTYAGIDTFEKRGGAWTRVANVSTFEPVSA